MGWSRVYKSGKLEPYRAMGDSVDFRCGCGADG